MNKNVIIGIIVVLIVIAGGFLFWKNSEAPTEERMTTSTDSKKEQMGGKDISKMEEASQDMMDMIKSGKKMECTYTLTPEQGQKASSIISVDGEKYSYVQTIDGMEMRVIFDGKYIYSWNSGETTGFMMDPTCMEELGGESVTDEMSDKDDTQYYDSSEDLIADFPEIDCKPTNTIDMSIPKNVQFTDQCDMIKQQQEMLKQLEGMPTGTMPDPEMLEKMGVGQQ